MFRNSYDCYDSVFFLVSTSLVWISETLGMDINPWRSTMYPIVTPQPHNLKYSAHIIPHTTGTIRLPNEQYMQLHQTLASLFYSGFRYEYYRTLALKGEITALKTV